MTEWEARIAASAPSETTDLRVRQKPSLQRSNAGHQARREAGAEQSEAEAVRRRLHAVVRLRCCALLQVPLGDCQAASVEAVRRRPVFGVCVLTDAILDPANLLSEQNPP